MSDEYQAWLDCDCDTCKALEVFAHDKDAWTAELERIGHECPRYVAYQVADYGAPPRRIDLFKVSQ